MVPLLEHRKRNFLHQYNYLPDSTIIAAEAIAVSFALYYYRYMGPDHHSAVFYRDTMPLVQAIRSEDAENPFICHIMNLLWLLNDKGIIPY